MWAAPGALGQSEHPLEPPDRSSPRATLATFNRSVDTAWERFSRRDPSFREALRVARECLDASSFSSEVADGLTIEAALRLKEVLDRIELPPEDEIPGSEAVVQQDLDRWTIPHTEISLVRVAEGERAGEFLFSVDTVKGAAAFLEKVKHLPYQPGKLGGHFEEIRSGALSPVLAPLAARLPGWARADVGGHLVWQWAVVGLAVLLSAALVVAASRWGRRWTAWEERASGVRRFGPLLFPLTLLATSVFLKWLIARFIPLAGYPYYLGRLMLAALTYLGVAWLAAVLLAQVGELVIRTTRAPERPLNAQLVRLSFRILTIVVVGGFLFAAAETLGFSAPALVAGLGVGGLAVALATQGTLENFIGGLIFYADQPVRVGDFFRFGDKMGVVEEIGLRSARIRTLDRTLVTVPNAELVKMQLENFTRRDRIRLRTLVRLNMETSADQLRFVLKRLWQVIEQHPKLLHDVGHVRFAELGEYSLDVELVAFAATTDWAEFLAIRQDVFLRILSVVEEAGTRLAVPARLELQAAAPGVDDERRRVAQEKARRWREDGDPAVPEYPELQPDPGTKT
jgi:MscS family membrane protein